jgi:biotin-(acetyl-CoA carboxylase) ligase
VSFVFTFFKGKTITVSAGENKIEGIFKGMTPEGFLILEQQGLDKIITTGDIFAFVNN